MFATWVNQPAMRGGTPAVTNNYTFSQVGSGWTFSYNDTSDATKRFLAATNSGHPLSTSIWVGWITGSAATVTLNRANGASGSGYVQVSVDGGDWTSPASPGATGGVFQLFTGLSDSRHLVCIRIGSSFGSGTANWMLKSGTVMTATGSSPAITPFGGWRQPYDGSIDTFGGSQPITTGSANYTPANVPLGGSTTYGPTPAAIRVKADYSTMVVASMSRYVFVSIDGAAPTIYDRGTNTFSTFGATVIEGLSGTHTYTVWTGSTAANGDGIWLSVGGLFQSVGVQQATSNGRLFQIGDSITYGQNASSTGHTDTFLAALSLGRVAGNLGVSGQTIAGVQGRIDTDLAAIQNVTSADAFIIAIGVNDGVTTVWDTTRQANYKYIIDACLAKGFGRVLCRAILPESDGTRATNPNNSLASLISTNYAGDPRVQFIDTATWPPVSSVGGGLLHPDDNGYRTLATYAAPAYAAAGA